MKSSRNYFGIGTVKPRRSAQGKIKFLLRSRDQSSLDAPQALDVADATRSEDDIMTKNIPRSSGIVVFGSKDTLANPTPPRPPAGLFANRNFEENESILLEGGEYDAKDDDAMEVEGEDLKAFSNFAETINSQFAADHLEAPLPDLPSDNGEVTQEFSLDDSIRVVDISSNDVDTSSINTQYEASFDHDDPMKIGLNYLDEKGQELEFDGGNSFIFSSEDSSPQIQHNPLKLPIRETIHREYRAYGKDLIATPIENIKFFAFCENSDCALCKRGKLCVNPGMNITTICSTHSQLKLTVAEFRNWKNKVSDSLLMFKFEFKRTNDGKCLLKNFDNPLNN